MNALFEGQRFRLLRIGDRTEFHGQILKGSGASWVLDCPKSQPDLGDAVKVEFLGAFRAARGLGHVAHVRGRTVVLQCSDLETVQGNRQSRDCVDGLTMFWEAPDGSAVGLRILNLSIGGFGFESDVEVPVGTVADFSLAINGQCRNFRCEVRHVRLEEDGMYRGGVRLLTQSRLLQALWAAQRKAA